MKIESVFESILGKQRHQLTLGAFMLERIYYSPDGRETVKGESLGMWLYTDEDVYVKLQALKRYYKEIAQPYFANLRHLKPLMII